MIAENILSQQHDGGAPSRHSRAADLHTPVPTSTTPADDAARAAAAPQPIVTSYTITPRGRYFDVYRGDNWIGVLDRQDEAIAYAKLDAAEEAVQAARIPFRRALAAYKAVSDVAMDDDDPDLLAAKAEIAATRAVYGAAIDVCNALQAAREAAGW